LKIEVIDDGEIIACMKAWLSAEASAKPIAFRYQIVFIRDEAAEMTENNAHEVMRGAERDYAGYTWKMIKVADDRNLFVVEGTKKQ
jgi:hypothetical protein